MRGCMQNFNLLSQFLEPNADCIKFGGTKCRIPILNKNKKINKSKIDFPDFSIFQFFGFSCLIFIRS